MKNIRGGWAYLHQFQAIHLRLKGYIQNISNQMAVYPKYKAFGKR